MSWRCMNVHINQNFNIFKDINIKSFILQPYMLSSGCYSGSIQNHGSDLSPAKIAKNEIKSQERLQTVQQAEAARIR